MKKFKLTAQERGQLERQRRLARDGRVVRRAQALIWLNEGRSITEVAKWSGVSRQTIYNWMDYFKSRGLLRPWLTPLAQDALLF
jgi:hypothetical protein